MLAQITEAQARMANDFAAVEFFFPEQNPQQGTLPGPIAADEAHLHIVTDGGLGAVEQNLIAVAFVGLRDL